jgi:hypothetical protein
LLLHPEVRQTRTRGELQVEAPMLCFDREATPQAWATRLCVTAAAARRTSPTPCDSERSEAEKTVVAHARGSARQPSRQLASTREQRVMLTRGVCVR